MWIGSPTRGVIRIAAYAALTLPLMPVQLAANLLGLRGISRWLPVYYHRAVCWTLGIKVQVRGQPSTTVPTLFVANHISYLDIEVMSTILPASFVARADMANWPFFGWLAKLQRSVFVERRAGATRAGREDMLRRLDTGDNLILFPEGTSSDGTRVLPFRSGLFAVAELEKDGRPIVVQPVCLAYCRLDGIPLGRYWRPLFAWFGDMELASHLWQAVCLGEVVVAVVFGKPVDIRQLGDRKALADHCFREISTMLQAINRGRVEELPPAGSRVQPA
jgi:lyso-ornithine lipid O-acyltransferase